VAILVHMVLVWVEWEVWAAWEVWVDWAIWVRYSKIQNCFRLFRYVYKYFRHNSWHQIVIQLVIISYLCKLVILT